MSGEMCGYFKNKHFWRIISKHCQIAFKNSEYPFEVDCFPPVTKKITIKTTTKQNQTKNNKTSLVMKSAIFICMLLTMACLLTAVCCQSKTFN